jgi:hypothetical protein
MMHPRSVDHEAAFASQRVVDRQLDYTRRCERTNQQQQQVFRQNVQAPGVLTEEAVVVRKVPLPDRSTRYDQVCYEAMAMGKHPPGHQLHEERKRLSIENNTELL